MKFNQITINEDSGALEIRFRKPDGGWHRTSVECGGNVDAQLQQATKGELPEGHAALIKAAAAELWTADMLAAAAERREREKAEAEAQRKAAEEASAAHKAEEEARFQAAVEAALAKRG